MNVHLLVVGNGPVALLRILTASMIEEAGSYRFANGIRVLTTELIAKSQSVPLAALDRQAQLVHDLNELILGVEGALQRSILDKVLEAPLRGAVLLLPGVVNAEQS